MEKRLAGGLVGGTSGDALTLLECTGFFSVWLAHRMLVNTKRRRGDWNNRVIDHSMLREMGRCGQTLEDKGSIKC
jgi:hypothetical protein